MAKNGCSEFFLKFFPKKTGINSEWLKMAVLNFFQQFFPKRLEQIWNGQKWPFLIVSNNIHKKTGMNSEWLKMAVLNFF